MRKILRIHKIKHFILKNIFKLLKYEFEAYIPNSAGKAGLINKLIKINIKDTNRNLALISEQFTEMSIVNLDDLIVDEDIRKKLNELFNLYQSDKNLHGYDKIYSNIFKDLTTSPTILEIGIGSTNINVASNMGKKGTPGGSLRAFSSFFENSEIYGADIDKDILFQEKNIFTFYIDQNQLDTYDNQVINNKEFDLIIDDGLHMQSANLNTLIFAFERLKKNGILIIEDVPFSALDTWKVVFNLIQEPYTMKTIKCLDNYVVMLKNR